MSEKKKRKASNQLEGLLAAATIDYLTATLLLDEGTRSDFLKRCMIPDEEYEVLMKIKASTIHEFIATVRSELGLED